MNTLKQRRNKMGLTQKQIATKLGLKESHYQAYEYGKRTPSVYMAMKIADALSVNVNNEFKTLWGEVVCDNPL